MMRFKRYTLFSLLLIVLVIAYTHLNIDTTYTLDFFGSQWTLPIALWVIVPAAALLIATELHFGFYALLGSMKRARLDKDLNKSKEMVKNAILHNAKAESVRDERLALVSSLLANSKLTVDENFYFDDEELNELVSLIKRIDCGEYVDLAKYKLSRDNDIYMKNQCNRLDVEPAYAEKVLAECDEANLMCMRAYEAYAGTAEKKRIQRVPFKKNKAVVMALLARFNAEKNPLELSKEEVVELCKEAEFEQKDFVKLARKLQTNLEPDELLAIFYRLQQELEGACAGYLYVNLELEKNDVAKEYLEQFDEEDFKPFRYYMTLKENGVKVLLSDFI